MMKAGDIIPRKMWMQARWMQSLKIVRILLNQAPIRFPPANKGNKNNSFIAIPKFNCRSVLQSRAGFLL